MTSVDRDMRLIEDLGLSAMARPGRRREPVSMDYIRDLTPADIALAAVTTTASGALVTPLHAIRTRHHTLARLIAGGESNVNAAVACGFTSGRVDDLARNDPAFRELVEYYKAEGAARYLDVHARLGDLGLSTIDELQHRIDNAPADMSSRELRELMMAALDRSIAPVKSGAGGGIPVNGGVPVQVNITFPGAVPTAGAEARIVEGVIVNEATALGEEP